MAYDSRGSHSTLEFYRRRRNVPHRQPTPEADSLRYAADGIPKRGPGRPPFGSRKSVSPLPERPVWAADCAPLPSLPPLPPPPARRLKTTAPFAGPASTQPVVTFDVPVTRVVAPMATPTAVPTFSPPHPDGCPRARTPLLRRPQPSPPPLRPDGCPRSRHLLLGRPRPGRTQRAQFGLMLAVFGPPRTLVADARPDHGRGGHEAGGAWQARWRGGQGSHGRVAPQGWLLGRGGNDPWLSARSRRPFGGTPRRYKLLSYLFASDSRDCRDHSHLRAWLWRAHHGSVRLLRAPASGFEAARGHRGIAHAAADTLQG